MNVPEPMRPASRLPEAASSEPSETSGPAQRHHLHFFVQDAGEGRAILRLSPAEDREGRAWDCRTAAAAERVALRYAASVAGEDGLARVVIESERDRQLWDVNAQGQHQVPAQRPGSASSPSTITAETAPAPPPASPAATPVELPPSAPSAVEREVEDPWVSKPRRLKVVPPLPAQAEPDASSVNVAEVASTDRAQTSAEVSRQEVPPQAPPALATRPAPTRPRTMQEQLLASRNRLAGASARVPQPDWDSIVRGTDPTPVPAATRQERSPRPSDLPSTEVVVQQSTPGTTSVVVDPVVSPVVSPAVHPMVTSPVDAPSGDSSRWVTAPAVSAARVNADDRPSREAFDDDLEDRLTDSGLITTAPLAAPVPNAFRTAPAPLTSPASRPAPEPLTPTGPAALPAQRGWRGLLVRAGMRVGPGGAERRERADHAAARRFWTGPRTIAVVNPKGGAGRTPTTAMLAAVFARHGGAVVAWDAAPGAGTLGWRTQHHEHNASAIDLRERLDDFLWTDARASDLMSFVHHQDEDLYDVLPARAMAASALNESWGGADVTELHGLLATYYRLVVVDTSASAEDPAWQAAVAAADQLVVVATPHPAVIASGRRLLEALTHRGGHHAALARGAVGVLTEAEPRTHRAAVAAAASGQLLPPDQVSVIPHDPVMVDGVLTYDRLHRRTQRAWLRAAALTATAMPEHSDLVVGDLA